MIELHNLHVALDFLGFLTLFAFSGLLLARIWLVPSAALAQAELSARWRQMLADSWAGVRPGESQAKACGSEARCAGATWRPRGE